MKKTITCPFCKSKTLNKWGDFASSHKTYGKRSSIMECDSCGLFFINPIPNEKELGKIYSNNYHYRPNKIFDFLLSVYTYFFDLKDDINLIKKYKHAGKMLDIGAGRGDFLSKFSQEKYDLWAYDPYISKTDIQLLQEKIGDNINNHKSLDDYPQSFFDVVILRNTIEHTTEFGNLLKSAKKLLKKNGILFIRTPNIESVDFKIFRTNWYEVAMPGHLVFFGPTSLNNMLKSLGFSVPYCKAVKHSYPLSLQRSIYSKLPFPLIIAYSLLFSCISPLLGQGGDVKTIARK